MNVYKRLPELSGLRGKVYPGQLKPQYPLPEPRIQSMKNQFFLERKGMKKNDNGHLMPPKIIMVEPIQK